MRVTTYPALRAFAARHPEAAEVLEAWYRITKRAQWLNFSEVKQTFNSADVFKDNIVIFDIGGNKYRLIAAIHYNTGKLFIREVLTHGEYEKGKWKKSL